MQVNRFLFCFLFVLSLTVCMGNEPIKKTDNRVLIFEIRGLTYELLERAYTPNINYLIENGYFGSYGRRERPQTVNGVRRNTGGIRRKIGRLTQCLDSMYDKKSSVYTVGIVSDTIAGLFAQRRKNFRSNESMIKDFINTGNGSNISFSFLSFRTIDHVEGPAQRKQIDYLTTVDSLIGIVFKSYQEQLKWENTTVILLSDGTSSHDFVDDERYFDTPIIIKSSAIPAKGHFASIIKNDDLISLVNQLLETNCDDGIFDDGYVYDRSMFSDTSKLTPFVKRPDIVSTKLPNKNVIALNLYSDENNLIFYTINDTNVLENGKEFIKEIQFETPGEYIIRAVSKNELGHSVTVRDKIVIRDNIYNINSDPDPAPNYTFTGMDILVDGDTATLDYKEPKWLGFQGTDVNFMFHFGNRRNLTSIDLSALQDYTSWIFMPNKVSFWVGLEPNNLIEIGSISYETLEGIDTLTKKHFYLPISESTMQLLPKTFLKKSKGHKYLSVKYLQVRVQNVKNAPEWFKLPGAQTWFFVDEIKIQ